MNSQLTVGKNKETLSVLLVEDDEDDYTLTVEVLLEIPDKRFSLEWAREYDEGLRLALSRPYDVVLLDYQLGLHNGIDLLKALRAGGYERPVIMLTGLAEYASDADALQAGASDYLDKSTLNARLLSRSMRYALERWQVQQAVRARERYFRALIENSLDGIFVLDAEGKFRYQSPSIKSILGYEPGQLSGSLFVELVHPEDQASLQAAWEKLLRDATDLFRQELRLRCQDGKYGWMEVIGANRLSDEDMHAVVLNYRDVTAHKAAEEEVRQMNAALEQRVQERTLELQAANQEKDDLLRREQTARLEAEKANATKIQFLGIVSHELRTPLMAIKGFSSSLVNQDIVFDAETQREFLCIIDQETDKLAELVAQLLDLSRLQAGMLSIKTTVLAFSEIVESVFPALNSLTKDHRLCIGALEDLPLVQADLVRTAQVLTNLVGNAVRYSEPGTAIHLAAQVVDGCLRVDVSDQGIGIAPEDQERVFEMFRQLDLGSSPAHGAGLGLAICKGIMEAQGGRIWIADRPGPGTTISFTLRQADTTS